MPASQHTSPKSDIAIAQEAKMRPILNVAKEKLGIAGENLDPYGHYKAKVSMDYIKSLQGKKDGKLILVTAISPTPASRRCSSEASRCPHTCATTASTTRGRRRRPRATPQGHSAPPRPGAWTRTSICSRRRADRW